MSSAIVDAHVHLWDAAHTPQPWMTPAEDAIARVFGPNDLKPLLDRNGVDAVVLVQGACLDSDTDYLCAEAERHEWIAAVTAWLRLDDPATADTRLAELLERPKVRGVRHLVHTEDDRHWIVRESVLRSLALLEEAGVVLEVPVVWPHHFDDVPTLAERFPALTIVIDHLGKPPLDAELDAWQERLVRCAAAPNVVAKLSGLNTATQRSDWDADTFLPASRAAFEAFGPGRLLVGSDWPVALLNGDYDRVWQEMRKLVAILAPGDEDALLGGTAARVYGIAA
jgi:L-fuconolactonase